MRRGAIRPHATGQDGNVFVFILIAIVLIGLVTVAIRSGSQGTGDVDKETVTVGAAKIRQYAAEVERGTALILSGPVSETDIRFAHANAAAEYGTDPTVTPQAQVFSPQGGGAGDEAPPAGANDGSAWEFYGNTAMPNVGSDKPDLIAVLPNVSAEICTKINADDGYAAPATLEDDGTCVNTGAAARFGAGAQYADGSPNTLVTASFPADRPILDACITCADGTHHYVHVLHAR